MPEHVDLGTVTGEPHARLFEEPRVVRLTLAAGESMPAHSHPGTDVVIHVLEGELTVELNGESHRCGTGELLRFDGDREVVPRAEADAVALVTIAARPAPD